jgi:hypothetical protein
VVIVVFNILGAVMLIVAVAIGFGVRIVTGTLADGVGDGPEMILMGSSCVFFDVTYRLRQPNGHWISPSGGGNIFFIPIWGIGAVWMVVGVIYCFTRPLLGDWLAFGLIGVLVAGALCLTGLQIAFTDRPNFSKLFADQSDESPATRPKSTKARTQRCPACNLPYESHELEDGKCPWCDESLEKVHRR